MSVQTLSLALSTTHTAESGDSTEWEQLPPLPLFYKSVGAGTSAVVDPVQDSQACAEETPPPSRYKGVVPQPNGRWGAQIYERHARVWLGTFPDQASAAAAYDVAALRLRGGSAALNFFKNTSPSRAELAFLATHSKNEIVDMLRKHTYYDELKESLRRGGHCVRNGAIAREQQFEKVVTPSDVGRLNRLVVPKRHAKRHFPLKYDHAATSGKGVLLNFEDEKGRVWRFRYSYWNSSQSYVLTKGWSRFVRDKGLKAGDSVVFSRSVCGDKSHLYIECKKRSETRTDMTAGDDGGVVMRLFGVDIGVGKKRGELPLLLPVMSSSS